MDSMIELFVVMRDEFGGQSKLMEIDNGLEEQREIGSWPVLSQIADLCSHNQERDDFDSESAGRKMHSKCLMLPLYYDSTPLPSMVRRPWKSMRNEEPRRDFFYREELFGDT